MTVASMPSGGLATRDTEAYDRVMHRRWVVGGLAGVLAVAAVGLAIRAASSGPARKPETIASVSRAFSAIGIPLEVEGGDGGVQQFLYRVHPLASLSNRPHTSRQGVVSVEILPTVAQAKILIAQQMNPADRDVCGGTTAADYGQWQARNVVASFSRCDYTRQPFREAATPAISAVAAVMHSIGG
jgi:hypothetical protein